MEITMIIFDAGGTLVGADNLFEEIALLFNHSSISTTTIADEFKYQKEQTEKKFYNVKELLQITSQEIKKRFGIETISFSVVDLYRRIYTETVYLYPGVMDALQFLKESRIPTILVSDADSDILIPQFNDLGIGSFFSTKIISSDVQAYKPSTKMVNVVREILPTNLEAVLFIGDSIDDVITAQKLGVRSIYIGGSKTDATYTVSKFEEAYRLIQNDQNLIAV